MKLYQESRERVAKHNLQQAMGKHTYTIGINQFSDMVIYSKNGMQYISTVIAVLK